MAEAELLAIGVFGVALVVTSEILQTTSRVDEDRNNLIAITILLMH